MEEQQPIIIVTESNKDIKKLGHYLMNMIGEKGESALWEEKHYLAQEPTLTSSLPFIFIGETKTSKMLLDSIEWSYDELNMRYGWIGKRAVIYVQNKDLSYEEYYKFKSLFTDQETKIKNGSIFDKVRGINERITKSDRRLKLMLLFLPYVNLVGWYSLIKGSIDSIKIRKQQYSYLVNKFLTEGLNDFIGDKK